MRARPPTSFRQDSAGRGREGIATVSHSFLLRQRLVDGLKRTGALRDGRVEAAMRAIPRHFFAPAADVELAYEDRVIGLKEHDGVAISTLSQPAMIAEMLQQLDVTSGENILEIGTGSGYTTALLAHLTGRAGRVVSVDLEPDLVRDASARFAQLGLKNIRAIAGDGIAGHAQGAPFERILLTASARDIETAWWEQLNPHGRIVLPLSFNGIQKSVAFDSDGGALVSRSIVDCAFIPLRPAQGATPDERARGDAVAQPDAVEHSVPGTYSRSDLLRGLALWAALSDKRACVLHTPADDMPCAALCDRDTTAILRWRHGLFVDRYGPDEQLARDLVNHVLEWDAADRPGRNLDIVAVRSEMSGATPPRAATFTVRREHSTFYLHLRR